MLLHVGAGKPRALGLIPVSGAVELQRCELQPCRPQRAAAAANDLQQQQLQSQNKVIGQRRPVRHTWRLTAIHRIKIGQERRVLGAVLGQRHHRWQFKQQLARLEGLHHLEHCVIDGQGWRQQHGGAQRCQ
jgi:hypothetical protein